MVFLISLTIAETPNIMKALNDDDVESDFIFWAAAMVLCVYSYVVSNVTHGIEPMMRKASLVVAPVDIVSSRRKVATNSRLSPGRSKAKRRVRFSAKPPQVHLLPNNSNSDHGCPLSEQDKQERWWRAADFRKFKDVTIMLSFELQRADTIQPHPASFSNTILKVFERCVLSPDDNNTNVDGPSTDRILDPTLNKQLEEWMGIGTLRVGLEKVVVPSVGTGCRELRHQCVAEVVEAQAKSKSDAEQIRQASLERSRYVIIIIVFSSL